MDDPEELPPVEPQVLNEIMLRLSQVHQAGKLLPVELDEPDGLDPEQRSLWRALRKRFPAANPAWVFSLCWRLIALSDLVNRGALDEWVIDEGNGEVIIPDCVVEAASSLPIVKYQPFNASGFLAELGGSPST